MRKIREIFGTKDEARLAPCKDDKPKRAGFFLFSGVLSLSTVSQMTQIIKTVREIPNSKDCETVGAFRKKLKVKRLTAGKP